MLNVKRFFESPKKAIISGACIVAILGGIGVGTAFSAKAIAQTGAIGADKAQSFAFADAGIDPVTATVERTDFEFEQGQFVYEVEFTANGTEYEYWVKASNGSIVKKEMDVVTPQGNTVTATAKLTLDRAKEIALEDAGLTAAQVTFTEGKLDIEDGVSVYEIEFNTADAEYDYEINAQTGAVYSKTKKLYVTQSAPSVTSSQAQQPNIDTPVQSGTTSQAKPTGLITLDKAKEIALENAGVAASNVTFKKASLEVEDGVSVYDIEFYTNTHEYEYEIDAKTKAIRDKDIEPLRAASTASNTASKPAADNASNAASKPATSTKYIGLDKAKEIALKHAGLAASAVSFSKAKLEIDDGQPEYEIEFYHNGTEYDYTIHAVSGAVLEHEAERD